MRPAKIVAIVIGALLILIGIGLVVPGGILLWIGGAHNEPDGFYSTSDRSLSSTGYALTTPDVDLSIGPGTQDWLPGGGVVQLRATSAGDRPVFIGIGPTDQVNSYLSGVAYDEVTDLGFWGASTDYRQQSGDAPPTPPGEQTFWDAQQQGPGTQTLRWTIQSGNWTAVIMNADGSSPVNASVSLGAKLGFLVPVGVGVLIGGLILLAIGITLVVLGARRPRKTPEPAYAAAPPYAPGQPYQQGQPQYGPYPPPYQPAAGQPPSYPPPYQAPPPPQPVTPPPPVAPPAGGPATPPPPESQAAAPAAPPSVETPPADDQWAARPDDTPPETREPS